MKTCKVKGCKNKRHAKSGQSKGLCTKHYMRIRRLGTLTLTFPQGLKPIERFKSKIKVNKRTKCWEWTNALNNGGYGQFAVNHKPILAHRFSYEYFIGKIPKGKQILHSCDNPKCVNPDHLSTGTSQDDADDKVNKNRQAKGEDIGVSKLGVEQVNLIRRLYKAKKNTYKNLADCFNVSISTINDILKDKTWKHIIG